MATSNSAEEIKIRACRGGSYANNLFFKLFFLLIYHCFTSKSNISSAFYKYLFTFLR